MTTWFVAGRLLARRTCRARTWTWRPAFFQRNTALNPTAEDFSAMAIVRDTMGDGAQQKQAKRKLDGVGDVHSSCGFANTPDRIRRLEVCVVQKDN